MSKNRIFSRIFLICIFPLLHVSIHAAHAADIAQLENIIEPYVPDQFMGTVLVAEKDNILLNKGYGKANIEWGILNTPETIFRIASLTKQFTAASILLLEERGELSTTDLISEYIPSIPEAWSEITIFHLLTHSSGIPEFTNQLAYRNYQYSPTYPEKLVSRFSNLPLDFKPGTNVKYSNSGYVLLGYLIELITNNTYEDFLYENIFKPLKMSNTGVDNARDIIPNRADGYTPTVNGLLNAEYVDVSNVYSAGELYSTTGDLFLWNQALYNLDLLSKDSLIKMTTPYLGNAGFGLGILKNNGYEKYRHQGGIQGFNSTMVFIPNTELMIIALGNLNGDGALKITTDLENYLMNVNQAN